MKRDVLSPVFFNLALEYAIRKFAESREGLQLRVMFIASGL
jgi:hypothetical protein